MEFLRVMMEEEDGDVRVPMSFGSSASLLGAIPS
jgi:hypothetical protein